MADAGTGTNSMLGTDVARRLIARPIRRHVAQTPRAAQPVTRLRDIEPIVRAETPAAPAAKRLEAEVRLMKAVIEAERRENANLRACVNDEDEDLGDEARAVRERWMRVVDRLLQASA